MPTATKQIPPLTPKLQARFWAKVDKINGPTMPHMESPCWQWMKSKRSGYGCFGIQGVAYGAHRIALTLAIGEIKHGLCAMHRCDNRACCNPNHLASGTRLDNNRDASSKGRTASGDRHGKRTRPESIKRGEGHGRAKLNAEKVSEIRRIYADGSAGLVALAKQFGVAQSAIWCVIKRRTWTHVS